MNALVIVDVQNDFCPGGALPVPEGDRIVPVINRLMERFDLVVATQDWHPANHISFASNHPGRLPGEQIDVEGIPQILWPIHCVQDTPGADFHPDLDRQRLLAVFRKGTDPRVDSYSAFFDNARRRATGLEAFLRQHGVSRVYLCGLATDYCVRFSALDAVALGFATSCIEDACRGIGERSGEVASALRQMREVGVEIVRAAEIP